MATAAPHNTTQTGGKKRLTIAVEGLTEAAGGMLVPTPPTVVPKFPTDAAPAEGDMMTPRDAFGSKPLNAQQRRLSDALVFSRAAVAERFDAQTAAASTFFTPPRPTFIDLRKKKFRTALSPRTEADRGGLLPLQH